MKRLLLISALGAPAVSWAQVSPLSGSANVHILELASNAHLYRHLRDTSTARYTKRLPPGGLVIVRATYGQWLAIRRAKSRSQFSKDTTTYYLPKRALEGAKVWVVL